MTRYRSKEEKAQGAVYRANEPASKASTAEKAARALDVLQDARWQVDRKGSWHQPEEWGQQRRQEGPAILHLRNDGWDIETVSSPSMVQYRLLGNRTESVKERRARERKLRKAVVSLADLKPVEEAMAALQAQLFKAQHERKPLSYITFSFPVKKAATLLKSLVDRLAVEE